MENENKNIKIYNYKKKYYVDGEVRYYNAHQKYTISNCKRGRKLFQPTQEHRAAIAKYKSENKTPSYMANALNIPRPAVLRVLENN